MPFHAELNWCYGHPENVSRSPKIFPTQVGIPWKGSTFLANFESSNLGQSHNGNDLAVLRFLDFPEFIRRRAILTS